MEKKWTKQSPCYKCPRRTATCRIDCTDWKQWRAYMDSKKPADIHNGYVWGTSRAAKRAGYRR